MPSRMYSQRKSHAVILIINSCKYISQLIVKEGISNKNDCDCDDRENDIHEDANNHHH